MSLYEKALTHFGRTMSTLYDGEHREAELSCDERTVTYKYKDIHIQASRDDDDSEELLVSYEGNEKYFCLYLETDEDDEKFFNLLTTEDFFTCFMKLVKLKKYNLKSLSEVEYDTLQSQFLDTLVFDDKELKLNCYLQEPVTHEPVVRVEAILQSGNENIPIRKDVVDIHDMLESYVEVEKSYYG